MTVNPYKNDSAAAAPRLAPLFDLTGRIALVTGGSRGLGLQIAEALGEFGAHVLVNARKPEQVEAAVRHLKACGAEASGFPGDISQPEGVERLVDAIAECGFVIDILVNNAGTSWGAPAEDFPLTAWDKVVATNMTAPFILTQAVGKRWMTPRRKGRVVNIASVEGLSGHHPRMMGTIAYNTAKGGLVNFTRALAAEWGPFGITVNAIAPGYFPSRLTDYVLEKHGPDLIDATPTGRLGGPADIKGAALLFASDAGAHVTGQILAVDGGACVI